MPAALCFLQVIGHKAKVQMPPAARAVHTQLNNTSGNTIAFIKHHHAFLYAAESCPIRFVAAGGIADEFS